MVDLIKKLNVLVKSSVRDFIGASESRPEPTRVSREVGVDVASLRARVNDAVAYEGTLRERVREHADEAARLNALADEAIERGDDAAARHFVEELQRVEQRRTIAENDLRAHQVATGELILRVNTLEATVANVRQAEQDARESDLGRSEAGGQLASEVRERLAALTDLLPAKEEQPPTIKTRVDEAAEFVDRQAVEDDLARRRQRLSK